MNGLLYAISICIPFHYAECKQNVILYRITQNDVICTHRLVRNVCGNF